ncbi:Hypothetical protein GSB_153658, partial [Giardia duodenalis]
VLPADWLLADRKVLSPGLALGPGAGHPVEGTSAGVLQRQKRASSRAAMSSGSSHDYKQGLLCREVLPDGSISH